MTYFPHVEYAVWLQYTNTWLNNVDSRDGPAGVNSYTWFKNLGINITIDVLDIGYGVNIDWEVFISDSGYRPSGIWDHIRMFILKFCMYKYLVNLKDNYKVQYVLYWINMW